MQTAPVDRVAAREDGAQGQGVLGERRVDSDNSAGSGGILMQRLLLARRKNLQFAPKVGSPLARARSYHELS